MKFSKNQKNHNMFALVLKSIGFLLTLMICLTVFLQTYFPLEIKNKLQAAHSFQNIEQIQCQNRGNRSEDIKCLKEVAGADIVIASILHCLRGE